MTVRLGSGSAISLRVLILLALGAMAGCSGGNNPSALAHGAPTAAGTSRCRSGDPLANVYHPHRLKVVEPCVTVSGTVSVVSHEVDGDIHFGLDLDPPYTHLLTPANHHGVLVVEIVPADQPGCTPGHAPRPSVGTFNYGICTGADERAPSVGSHVFVTGPYVLDENHDGWAEVHPVWAISSTASSPRVERRVNKR